MTQPKRKTAYTRTRMKEETLSFSHQYQLTLTHSFLSEVIT